MAEATEIISVVRIGVSLVEYIYKVFAPIFDDMGVSDVDWTGEILSFPAFLLLGIRFGRVSDIPVIVISNGFYLGVGTQG